MPSPLSGPSGRRARATLAIFAVALIAAIGARACRSARARSGPPTGTAEWIWAPLGRTVEPLAFYLARDFELAPTVPASARLLAMADEEYVLYLNGKRVGAAGVSPGARPILDAYEVAPLLRAGANRLVAELRSGRGAGGFLLRLADGGGRTLAATDSTWTVVRRYHPGLVRGWLPLSGPAAIKAGGERETAASWSRPPTGRWGAPREVVSRSPFAAGAASALPIPALPVLLAPGTVRIDLGRVVEGYLALEVTPRQLRQVGLVLFAPTSATEPPRTPMILAPGAPVWMSVRPRSFRSAVVAGDLEVTGARVYPAVAAPPPLRDLRMKGLFGLKPPIVRSPVEDEVGRELQRLWIANGTASGTAGGGKAIAGRTSG